MHYRNSSFQVKYFLVSKCHTSDEARRMLLELHEERDVAIRNSEAAKFREQAKKLKAQRVIDDKTSDELDVLEAKADLAEMDAFKDQSKAVLEEALRERDYIESLLEEILPLCKYADLPIHEANQLAQEEEWKLELLWRAENFLASQGTIPHDHLATMRLHPAFETALLPHIVDITDKMNKKQHKLEMHQMPGLLLEHDDQKEST